MWDIVWVSPQGHRLVSVSRHFLLQAPQCPCSVRKRFSRDHCFGFEIQTSAILEFYFRFRSRPVICMLFCIRLSNFVQIGAPTAEIWRHIHFSRWRPWPLNTTSGFLLVDVALFRRSKSISKPNFVHISQLAAEISGFETQTSAILEFYFRFRFRAVRRNLHVILHQAAEFRPNRNTHCGNMTSYPFLKMAAPDIRNNYFGYLK